MSKKKRPCLKKLRDEAYLRQNGLCIYCNKPMWTFDVEGYAFHHSVSVKQASWFQCTGEHLVAHSDGGPANRSNIVAACKFCNVKRHKRKRPRDPVAYASFVKRRLEKGCWNDSFLKLSESPWLPAVPIVQISQWFFNILHCVFGNSATMPQGKYKDRLLI